MSEEREDVLEEREDLISAEDAVEEVKDEEVLEEELETEEPEIDENVQQAKKYGHLSKEEWIAQGRDPDQWKSPEEFNNFGKMYDQLKSLNKKIDQRDREIQALVEYQKRTSQREYERAKKELENRLAAAKDDMDIEGVEHYKEELVKLNHMEQQDQVQQYQQEQQQALNSFKERNAHWFNDRNPDLMERAIAIDSELKSIYPNATYQELAQKIETRMQYEYPERVGGQVKSRPTVSPSQSSVNKTVANKNSVRKTFQSLSQELKDTFSVYKRMNPDITEADFIARLKKDGEI